MNNWVNCSVRNSNFLLNFQLSCSNTRGKYRLFGHVSTEYTLGGTSQNWQTKQLIMPSLLFSFMAVINTAKRNAY